MPFTPISSLFSNRKLSGVLNAAMIVDLSGQVVGDQATVISFKNGLLKLNVPSSVAAVQLKMTQDELINKINSRLGQDLVKKISYKVGN